MQPTDLSKRSYHPFILIAYYLNFLPIELLQSIPNSTRYDWKHKDLNALFGTQYFNDNKELFKTLEAVAQHQKLQKTIRVLLQVIAFTRFIKTYHERLKVNLQNIQQVAVWHIKKINTHLPLHTIFKLLHIDPSTYYQWRNRVACKYSAINQCTTKHPSQLLPKEVQQIKNYTDDERYTYWSLASLYHLMKRDGKANYYLTTFYKYCKALKVQRLLPKHRRKNKTTGIRAEHPLQLLHIDVTIFTCLNRTKAYIYVIKDNCSKAILHSSAHLALKAEYTLQALSQVYEQYKHLLPQNVMLMTDGGSENRGIKTWILEHNLNSYLQHIVAQIDTHFSNSMVEAANRSIKYHGLYRKIITDFAALQKELPIIQGDHFHKPLHDLGGRTPYEVLHQIPYPKIPSQNIITRQNRIAQNKLQLCCSGFSF